MNDINWIAIVITALLSSSAGAIAVALIVSAKRADTSDAVVDDGLLLDYLEQSEMSLLFNTSLTAWGLVDAANKCFAAGETPRAAIRRARAKDAAVQEFTAA